MNSKAHDGKDAVQEVNWPATIPTSAERTELKEVELVELDSNPIAPKSIRPMTTSI